MLIKITDFFRLVHFGSFKSCLPKTKVILVLLTIIFVSCDLSVSERCELPEYRIIAHRGFWRNSDCVENSISSLLAADSLGVFGIEIDISKTEDDSLIVAHGPLHCGLNISSTPFSVLRELRLENGEMLPSLREFIRASDSIQTKMTIIVEIKSPGSETEIVDILNNSVFKNRVIFSSYSMTSCQRVLHHDSLAFVANLRGVYSPFQLSSYGVRGMFYDRCILDSNITWIDDAHQYGLYVSAAVNDSLELSWAIDNGIDYFATDQPDVIKDLINKRYQ